MPSFIAIVSLVFVLDSHTIGTDIEFLPRMEQCDEIAIKLIVKDLKQYPTATDFGWWCQQIPLEGHPPADLLKDHPDPPPPEPHIPGDKEA